MGANAVQTDPHCNAHAVTCAQAKAYRSVIYATPVMRLLRKAAQVYLLNEASR